MKKIKITLQFLGGVIAVLSVVALAFLGIWVDKLYTQEYLMNDCGCTIEIKNEVEPTNCVFKHYFKNANASMLECDQGYFLYKFKE